MTLSVQLETKMQMGRNLILKIKTPGKTDNPMLSILQESRVTALQEYVQQLCKKVDTEARDYLKKYESSLKGIQM